MSPMGIGFFIGDIVEIGNIGYIGDIGYIRFVSRPLLLLHGAIGSSAQLKPLADEFRKSGFDPKLFDFAGHGGRDFPEEPFSIPFFAEEVISWMNDHRIRAIDIFGYSMGGYVALYLAKYYPDRVGKVMTVATKFAWDIATSEKEVKMLNPEKIAEKIPKFAAILEKRHAPQDWKEVLRRTADMMIAMGVKLPLEPDDFRTIWTETLLCAGDQDTMVTKDETTQVMLYLKRGRVKLLENTPHPIEQMNITELTALATQFYNEPEETTDSSLTFTIPTE